MHVNSPEDNKKYFNEKEYSTLFIQKEKDNEDYSLIEVLKEHESSERRLMLIDKLRNQTGLDFLVDQIEKNKKDPEVNILIGACWEIAIDCASKLEFFVQQAIEGSFMSCLEVVTLVEEYIYSEVDEKRIDDCVAKVQSQIKIEKTDEKKHLLEELKKVLLSLKHS